ncbi:MAG TPA: DUF1259 domain-containing protein [Planctomycetota bacterium]|jgi:hypothetical protein
MITKISFCTAILAFSLAAAEGQLDTARIEKLTGLKGQANAKENTFKLTAPRTDVAVTVAEQKLPPFMGLASWVTFMPEGDGKAMLMGDLVLFQDEVNPIMSLLLDSGFSVTALHNHFFFDKPKVYFMHIYGMAETDKLCGVVLNVFDNVKHIRAAAAQPAEDFPGAKHRPEKNAITAAALERILNVPGQSQDGMFKVVIGRETKMPCGCEAGASMGVNTWAGFAGDDENAVVDGDFAVLENELQPVLKALRHGNINVLAIHNHMTGENPRFVFLHYWGEGPADRLARTIKAALDLTGKPSPAVSVGKK